MELALANLEALPTTSVELAGQDSDLLVVTSDSPKTTEITPS
jgi:hypothetical protein